MRVDLAYDEDDDYDEVTVTDLRTVAMPAAERRTTKRVDAAVLDELARESMERTGFLSASDVERLLAKIGE